MLWAKRVGRIAKALLVGSRYDGAVPDDLGEEEESVQLPFVFQDDEQLLMVRLGTKYLEDRKRSYTVYGGGLGGFILGPIARNSLRGYGAKQEYQERVHVGTGVLAVTTQRLYFHCPVKSLRIPFKKIVMCIPCLDGFEISQDGANALPQLFVTGVDGTDVYQAIQQRGQRPELLEPDDEEE
jgi:hypothetical protein